MYPLMSSQSVVKMKVDMKICNLSLLVYFDTVGMWWEDKVVPVLINKPPYHKDKWESGSTNPQFLNPFMLEVVIFGICARNSYMLPRKIQGTRI